MMDKLRGAVKEGRYRSRSMGDEYEGPSRRHSTGRRSSFSEIVVKKWHQPHRDRRDSFKGMTFGAASIWGMRLFERCSR